MPYRENCDPRRFLATARSSSQVGGIAASNAENTGSACMMTEMGSSAPSPARLLAIIELQNAIAAAAMHAEEVMHIVAERAGTLTSAEAGMVALGEGDELVYRAVPSGRYPASWTVPS